MYYLHFNNSALWFKTRKKSTAFLECMASELPVNVSVLKHGKFTQVLCNLKHSKNIYMARK